jgi:hypothetical protein
MLWKYARMHFSLKEFPLERQQDLHILQTLSTGWTVQKQYASPRRGDIIIKYGSSNL